MLLPRSQQADQEKDTKATINIAIGVTLGILSLIVVFVSLRMRGHPDDDEESAGEPEQSDPPTRGRPPSRVSVYEGDLERHPRYIQHHHQHHLHPIPMHVPIVEFPPPPAYAPPTPQWIVVSETAAGAAGAAGSKNQVSKTGDRPVSQHRLAVLAGRDEHVALISLLQRRKLCIMERDGGLRSR